MVLGGEDLVRLTQGDLQFLYLMFVAALLLFALLFQRGPIVL